jgi:hypothetical protein
MITFIIAKLVASHFLKLLNIWFTNILALICVHNMEVMLNDALFYNQTNYFQGTAGCRCSFFKLCATYKRYKQNYILVLFHSKPDVFWPVVAERLCDKHNVMVHM